MRSLGSYTTNNKQGISIMFSLLWNNRLNVFFLPVFIVFIVMLWHIDEAHTIQSTSEKQPHSGMGLRWPPCWNSRVNIILGVRQHQQGVHPTVMAIAASHEWLLKGFGQFFLKYICMREPMITRHTDRMCPIHTWNLCRNPPGSLVQAIIRQDQIA